MLNVEIHPMPASLDKKLVERYKKIAPPTVGHILNFGFMATSIRPLHSPGHIIGRAITVQISSPDSALIHKVTEMIEPGDVVVVDTCGNHTHACWGEMVTRAAVAKQCAGAVIDGPATDVKEVMQLAFPVYCRGTSALTTKVYGRDGRINVPIQCGGVSVNPGDMVLADDNGVVVMSPEIAASIIETAETIESQEISLRVYLAEGGSLPERSGANRLLRERFHIG